MHGLRRLFGVARSLAMYHGVPGRGRRLARFYSQFVASGSLVFDIGAHAGSRVRAFRRLGARVVALEPQPDFVRLLGALCGRDQAVTIVESAVGAAPGRARLQVSDATPTVTTLSSAWAERVGRDPAFADVAWRPGPEVDITTLDALIDRYGIPDFVKIDVEGYEADVLRGLGVPLPALSFEYVACAPDAALACIDRLDVLGRYCYNGSRGESLRLDDGAWRDARGMRAWLQSLDPSAGSGDIYARRIG